MNPFIPPEFALTSVWLWESFGKEIVSGAYSTFKGQLQNQWEKIEWTIAAKKYRQKVYELYSTMRMLGNPNPILIESIFTDIYILDRPTALKRYNFEEIKSEKYNIQDGNRVNALELVKKEQRLFILGKPGAGKTTLMKYVTLLSTKGIINKIPIFISLNDWALSKTSLMDYIERQFDICSFPDAKLFIREVLLKKGRAMVLFDGLDEVNEENDKRREITRQISDFTNQYSENSYIITCRVAATDYSFEKFPYVEVADFTDAQVEIFVEKWFVRDLEKGKRCLGELQKPENKRLRELGKTPVLLNLLCLNYDESLSFPTRRAEIYQEGIDVLLKKWDASRNIKRDEIYKGLTYGRRHQLFSRLAAEYFEKGETLFKEDELSNNISNILQTFPLSSFGESPDGFYVLRSIEAQHGLLIERAHRIHSFSHLTFQEYFTARNIVDNVADNSLDKLMQHVTEKRWREVFLLTVSLLADARFFFEAFHKKSVTLFPNSQSVYRILNETLEKAKSYKNANKFTASNYVLLLNLDLHKIKHKMEYLAKSSKPSIALAEYRGPVFSAQDEAMKWLESLAQKQGTSADDLLEDDTKIADENIESNIDYQIDLVLRNIFEAMLNKLEGICIKSDKQALNTQATSEGWKKLFEFSKEQNLDNLLDDLHAINVQHISASQDKSNMDNFLRFAHEYQSALIKHRNIGHEINIDSNEKDSIEKYFRALVLMSECLRLAVVADRQKIENQLLQAVGRK
jgi:predicted NACHT family NTPase